VDDPLLMGELHHFGQLPHEVEPGGEREVAIAGGEEVIEPDRIGVVLEDDGRAELVLREVLGLEDSIVLEVFEQLVLADRGPLAELTLVSGRAVLDGVDPNAAAGVGEGHMARLPVLECRSLVDLPVEHVVAHPALAV